MKKLREAFANKKIMGEETACVVGGGQWRKQKYTKEGGEEGK